MKLLIAFLIVPFLSFSQQAQTPNSNPQKENAIQGPAIKFIEESFDFGKIPQGKPVTHVFEFENTGNQPLLVSQATASCGCTTPVWTKEPVLPGKKGTVTVTFNAANEGTFIKTVTVLSNATDPVYLSIKGTVEKK